MASKKTSAPRPPPIPRHETMEVETSWLEPDSNPPPAKGPSSAPPRRRVSQRGAASDPVPPGAPPAGHVPRMTMDVQMEWLEVEEPPPAAPHQSKAKRTRQPWEPPTLPPPPSTAARARRVIPPPLPRGEDEPSPAPKKPPRRA